MCSSLARNKTSSAGMTSVRRARFAFADNVPLVHMRVALDYSELRLMEACSDSNYREPVIRVIISEADPMLDH